MLSQPVTIIAALTLSHAVMALLGAWLTHRRRIGQPPVPAPAPLWSLTEPVDEAEGEPRDEAERESI